MRLLCVTHDDFLHAPLQHVLVDLFSLFSTCEDGTFIEKIFQISSGKSDGCTRDRFEINILGKWLVFGMNLEDSLSIFEVWEVYSHLSIKSAWSKKGLV